MSGPLVKEALLFAPADLTALELLVLVALAESAPTKDRTARFEVGTESLADKVRAHPSTVKNALGELVNRGLVVKLIDKPRKGLAQNYQLAPLNKGTRNATLRVAATRPKEAAADENIGSATGDPNGTGPDESKGRPGPTLTPVDNSPRAGLQRVASTPSKGSPPRDPSRKDLLPENPKTVPSQVPRGVGSA